jgi:hypothetical protein
VAFYSPGSADGETVKGTLHSRARPAGGVFGTADSLTDQLWTGGATGTGAVSMIFGTSGAVHLVYQCTEVPNFSTPRYHTNAGSAWSYRKTLDNAVFDGVSGISPTIGLSGDAKVSAFFFRKAGQSPPAVADLRLASWVLADDTPTVEILDQSIPADDETNPMYRVAMAVDHYGLIHLAILRPVANTGYLSYQRQTIVAGKVKWLSDVVDDNVMTAIDQAHVDIVVDENARPHIAYSSSVDGNIYYATRYDR